MNYTLLPKYEKYINQSDKKEKIENFFNEKVIQKFLSNNNLDGLYNYLIDEVAIEGLSTEETVVLITEIFTKWGIDITEYLTTIPMFCFAYSGLKSIDIPENIKEICQESFCGCYNLSKIVIPGNINRIGIGAFDGCQRLKDVHIKEGVKIIDGCFKLINYDAEILLPDSINHIGSDIVLSFQKHSITFYGHSGTYAEERCNQLGLNFKVFTGAI